MRLAIIAAATSSSPEYPTVGERDASLVESRLAMADLGYETHLLDPSRDLAEQLDQLLHEGDPEDVLFYTSCLIALVDEGDCYLCLDPEQPDIGDAAVDLASIVVDKVGSRSLFILDARYDSEELDTSPQQVVEAIRSSINPDDRLPVEIVAAARPLGAHNERIPSRLTAGLLEVLDDISGGLTAERAFGQLVREDLGSWPNAVIHAPGALASFALRRPKKASDLPPDTQRRGGLNVGDEIAGESLLDSDRRVPVDDQREPETLQSPAPPPQPVRSTPVRVRVQEEEEEPLLPSERSEAASVTIPLRRQPKVPSEQNLPKVMLSPAPPSQPMPPSQSAPYQAMPQAEPPSYQSPSQSRSSQPSNLNVSPDPAPTPPAVKLATTAADSPSALRQPEPDKPESAHRMPPPPPKRRSGADLSSIEPTSSPAAQPGASVPPASSQPPEAPDPDVEPSPDTAISPVAFEERAEETTERPSSKDLLAKLDSAEDEAPPSDTPPLSFKRGMEEPSTFLTDDEPAENEPAENEPAENEPAESEPPLSFSRPVPAAPPTEKPLELMSFEDHLEWGDWELSVGMKDKALTYYKNALGKLGTMSTPARAEVYLRIAELNRKEKPRIAIANFDKALAITPDNPAALTALVQLNIDQRDWTAAEQAEEQLGPHLTNKTTRFDRRLDFARRWLEAGEIDRARRRFESLRDEFPKRQEPLDHLLAIYQEEKTIDHVLDTRRRLAMLIDDREERSEAYFELGSYCLFELDGREQEAFAAFELALDANPTHLEAVEVLATALADEQEWADLERVYLKQIRNLQATEPEQTTPVVAELYRRLALLYRDHLDDKTSALEALEQEMELRPDNSAVFLMAADLAEDLKEPAKAVKHLRRVTLMAPRRADLYHRLFKLAQTYDEPDLAFMAASVTSLCGDADERERIVHTEHRVETVPGHQRPMRPAAWQWIRDSDRDTDVDRVMRAIAPAILRMRIVQLDKEGRLADLPPEKRILPEDTSLAPVRSLAWCSENLSIPLPAIFIDKELDGTFVAPIAKIQSTVIGRRALTGRTSGELAFLAGRHLAMRLPEHELMAHHHSKDELTACFMAALEMALGTSPASGTMARAVATLSEVLRSGMSEVEQSDLIAAVASFQESGGKVNLNRWVASVERSSNRVGLLMCGDLETAVRVLHEESAAPAFLSVDVRIDDLCSFAVSAEYIKLRQELGSAISDHKTLD